jgi:hypothetical protein
MRVTLIAVIVVALSSCTNPTTGPGAAAGRFLDASLSRDAETLHGLLTQETHQQIETLHKTLSQSRELIAANYEGDTARAALKASGAGILDAADTPIRLFSSLITRNGVAQSAEGFEKRSLRIRSVKQEGRTAVVTTWGGDSVRLIVEQDEWRVQLSGEDAARLQSLIANAKTQLLEIRKKVALNNAQRFGVKKQ